MVSFRELVFNTTMQEGKVYLIGAGPGDTGLMTIKGRELISKADVVIYDALSSLDMLQWAKPQVEKIYVGKRASRHALPQEEINQLLVKEAKKGLMVVRLKGGDPYVFGRGGEEADALVEAGVGFEVVPGITSAIAGPAYAGIPVTHRAYCTQFTVFTGHEDPTKPESTLDIEGIAKAKGTKVVLMGMSNLARLMKQLVEHGQSADTPVAIVQWATTGRQRSVDGTVDTIAKIAEEQSLGAPAIIVIGDVVKERTKLDWFEKLPLFGRRIVVTRTRKQAGALSHKLAALGAEVVELPTIKIVPPSNPREFAEAVVHSHSYDWLVFTSPNGVDKFFEGFFAVYSDIRSIGGARIAAIGPGTAAKLKAHGLAVDVLAKESVAEGLVQAFKDAQEDIGTLEHMTMLWVHGEQARRVVADGLTSLGAIVDECIAYDTEPELDDPTGAQQLIMQSGADVITFTSSSTVESFMQLDIEWPENCIAASIGPITSRTLHEHGIEPEIEAQDHDINGLVKAIVEFYQD